MNIFIKNGIIFNFYVKLFLLKVEIFVVVFYGDEVEFNFSDIEVEV